MPTKAELELELQKLSRQVAKFERPQEEPSVTTELEELRHQYKILEQKCAELELSLEEEHMARQVTETVASEVKQELLLHKERFERCVDQIREEIENTHKRESDAQADLIGMLKLKLTKVSSDCSLTNARTYMGVSHKAPTCTIGRGLDTNPSHPVSREETPRDTVSSETQVTHVFSHGTTKLSTQADERPQASALPQLPTFGGKGQDDGDSYDKWLHKLDRHAALQKWSPYEKLLQLVPLLFFDYAGLK